MSWLTFKDWFDDVVVATWYRLDDGTQLTIVGAAFVLGWLIG